MDTVSIIIGGSLLFVAALMIGLHIPLLQDKVKMNPLYGMRLSTRQD